MSISRKHPVANWVRLEPHEHRRALDKVLQFRDQSDDPMASGLPDAAVRWFYDQELPRLLQRPNVRQQCREHVADLIAKSQRLRDQIDKMAGSLIEKADAIDAEANALVRQLDIAEGTQR